MIRLAIIFFFVCTICFPQSKQEREEKLKAKKENLENDSGESYLGINFKIGDTLVFSNAEKYLAIYEGRGLSIKPITNSLKNTKCVIFKFKNSYGTDYTYCKDLDNQTYMLSLKSAIVLNEIILSDKQKEDSENFLNPPRDIPEDYIPFNFQGVTWQTTKSELKKLFPEGTSTNNGYSQSTEVAGLKANLLFSFNQDKINLMGYVFDEKHTSKNLYIEDYSKLKNILIQKYGDPDEDKTNWRNSLYKNDYEDYGMAVSIGHLEYYTKWKLPDTDIILKLYGDNYDINLIVGYYKYPQDKKELRESDLSKF